MLVSFWDGLSSGAMLVSGRVNFPKQNLGLRICKFDSVLKSEDEDYGHDV